MVVSSVLQHKCYGYYQGRGVGWRVACAAPSSDCRPRSPLSSLGLGISRGPEAQPHSTRHLPRTPRSFSPLTATVQTPRGESLNRILTRVSAGRGPAWLLQRWQQPVSITHPKPIRVHMAVSLDQTEPLDPFCTPTSFTPTRSLRLRVMSSTSSVTDGLLSVGP